MNTNLNTQNLDNLTYSDKDYFLKRDLRRTLNIKALDESITILTNMLGNENKEVTTMNTATTQNLIDENEYIEEARRDDKADKEGIKQALTKIKLDKLVKDSLSRDGRRDLVNTKLDKLGVLHLGKTLEEDLYTFLLKEYEYTTA